MKVMSVLSAHSAPVFQRRLRENEKQEYRQNTLQEAFDYLGIKEMALIMHGSSFPVESQDFGVGSPYSKESQDVIKLEMLHGFNNNQLGPNGKLSKADVSPYKSTVFARNELFIDLKALKNDEYANILDDKSTNNLLSLLEVKYKNDDANYAYSKFYDAFENYDIALNAAYDNFQKKLYDKDEKALKLNSEFNEFKQNNKTRLMKESLFKVLNKTYGSGDFRVWDNPVDKNLINLLRQRDPAAIERYNYLTAKFKKEINVYKFEQFIADKQIKENKQFRKDNNFKYISDMLVGFSECDEWINKDAFLENWRLGCPNGGTYGPQMWDVPVLDPNKLFNADGTLGIAGKLLKEKIDRALEDCENVRIDHALGLIDPYVYDENTVEIINGNLSDKFKAGNISHLGLDPNCNYKNILEKIIIPSMKEHGLDPQDAVWEDLSNNEGTWFYEVYKNKHNLPGITQLEFSRSEGSSRKNWALLGSHDSQPALKLLNEQEWARNHSAWEPQYLAGFLHWDKFERAKERDEFCQRIANNNLDRVKAKFAELFMNSEKIQISFADFFGLDKVYNYGGRNVDTNWKLRLSKDYEDAYYKNLSSDKPTALNLPEILKIAVKAQMDREYIQYKNGGKGDAEKFKQDLKTKMQPLLERLDKFTAILKEKED